MARIVMDGKVNCPSCGVGELVLGAVSFEFSYIGEHTMEAVLDCNNCLKSAEIEYAATGSSVYLITTKYMAELWRVSQK